MLQHESDTIIFLAETTVRRFLPALFKLLFSFRPACCKLSSGRQPILLCSVYALMSPSLIKGFLYERFRLVSPWCWNVSIVSFCSAFLLKIIVHLFSILYPLSIILIPSSELVAGSYHLFYFAKTSDSSFSSSLIDFCYLPFLRSPGKNPLSNFPTALSHLFQRIIFAFFLPGLSS